MFNNHCGQCLLCIIIFLPLHNNSCIFSSHRFLFAEYTFQVCWNFSHAKQGSVDWGQKEPQQQQQWLSLLRFLSELYFSSARWRCRGRYFLFFLDAQISNSRIYLYGFVTKKRLCAQLRSANPYFAPIWMQKHCHLAEEKYNCHFSLEPNQSTFPYLPTFALEVLNLTVKASSNNQNMQLYKKIV